MSVWRGSCPKCGYWAFTEDHPGILAVMERHYCHPWNDYSSKPRSAGPVEIRKQEKREVFVEDLGEWIDASDRDPNCVLTWPGCRSGGYDPHCCRFPKSCSC